MSGALIVEGMERYVPALRSMRERVLVIRTVDIEHDPRASTARARVQVEQPTCGHAREEAERLFTINGLLRPQIEMRPGEPQFWRIVNAAADRYVDIEVPGQQINVVAFDGFPVAYHDPTHPSRPVDHVLLPPAGRVEAIVPGQAREGRSVLRTRCVDTGPDGDPNPGMILADVASTGTPTPAEMMAGSSATPPFKIVDVESIERSPARFIAVFSEDEHGFYINDQKFSVDAQPMVRVKVGEYQHWRIVNNTRELHPMHIHQTHFLAFRENDLPLVDPRWLDTVNVPVGGSVDVVMDFTDPKIRGMSVFHCHLLNHEDKGMMAKILFE
jgi:FtsP/CotA-like multicopper oxidase with cupredoxin domain